MAELSGTKRKVGRPPIPKEVARTERVVTFLTAIERAQLVKLAEETDRSISSTCHQLISEALERHTHQDA